MADAAPEIDPVAELAEEFVARYRRGERPALTEYAQKHPELAEHIRRVFPMMILMEQAAPAEDKSQPATFLVPSTGALGPQPRPEQLGGYRILREIGRGGMGIVYEAEQLALGRHVALKVLPLRATKDPSCLQRFRLEAQAAARLHHTHIVPVYEVGEQEDICYYAMQYIHGQPLDEVLDELRGLRRDQGKTHAEAGNSDAALASSRAVSRAVAQSLWRGLEPSERGRTQAGSDSSAPLPVEVPAEQPRPEAASGEVIAALSILQLSAVHYYRSVAKIGVQVAGALSYAHREGVIHRDIKPSNLLLDLEGCVWVTDFGLAKTADQALTGSGDLVGTLRYMPPERFRGWSDPRSDLYSLGLTLYEMLALRPAFADADHLGLVHQLLHVDPPRLRKVDRHIPRDLATIVTKAIDKEPGRRYQTADELAADLQRFLEDRPVQARQVGPVERTWRWCKRNPALATLTTGFLLALVLGLIGVTWQWLRAEANAATAEDNLAKAKETGEQLRQQLWQSSFDQAQARTYSGQAGQRYKGLEAVREAAQLRRTPELRDLAIACLALTDLRVGKEWQGAPDGTNAMAFDEPVERYARSDKQGNVSVRRVADDTELALLPCPQSESGLYPLRFSPDGKYLAGIYTASSSLYIWDLERRSWVWKQPVNGHAFTFTPDSRQIVIGRRDGSLNLFDLATGVLVRPLGKVGEAARLSVSPDGTRLASSHYGGTMPHEFGILQVRDMAGGAVLMIKEHPLPPLHGLAWHPYDPDLLATSGWGIYLWDVRTNALRAKLPGQAGPTVGIAFSHNGDVLASTGWSDTSVRLWDPWTGRQLVRMTPAAMQFSPDDRRLAYAKVGNNISLLDLEVSREYRAVASHAKVGDGLYPDMDVSPDGRWLAVASRGGNSNGIHLWDLATGRVLRYLPVGSTYSVRFDPQGRALISGHDGGLAYWPMRAEGQSVRHLGPPRWLRVPGPAGDTSISPDGRRLAVAPLGLRGSVLELANPDMPAKPSLPAWLDWDALSAWAGRGDKRVAITHDRLANIAISPDGRWVATGTHHGQNVMISDAATGEQVRTLPAPWNSRAEFSPDGKWLVTGIAAEYRIYETAGEPASWQLRHTLSRRVGGDSPGPIAFSPDSRVLAVVVSGFAIQLIDPATSRVLANLEPPDRNRDVPGILRFSPDGSQLVECTINLRSIHVWDLRLIGTRLSELGLDWTLPPYPPAEAGTKPLQLAVNLGMFTALEDRNQARRAIAAGDWSKAVEAANRALAASTKDVHDWRLRAEANLGLKKYDQAVADYQRSLSLALPDAATEHRLAARLAASPGLTPEHAAQAVQWAEQAVTLEANNAAYLHTLGVAYYRAEKWDESIKALRDSQKVVRRADAYTSFVLAMAHWKRGDKEEARAAHAAALRWMEQHAPENAELHRLRDEAVACARAALRLELDSASAAIKKDPLDAAVHYRRGRVHYDLHHYAPARDDFSRALALNPEHVEAYHYRGHAHQYLTDHRAAADDFTAALQRAPKNAHLYNMRAVSLYRLKQPERALEDWQRSFDLNPKQAAVCHALASLSLTGPQSLRDPAKALSLAEQAVRLAPGGYSYLTALGVAHYRLGHYDKAVDALIKAATARKDGPTAVSQFFLAMSYHRLGDPSRARAAYDHALAWWQAQSRLNELQVEELNAFRAEADVLLKDR